MPKKEKIANTYVSAILNSNGGDGESRTRVRIKHHSDDYSLDHFVTFVQL